MVGTSPQLNPHTRVAKQDVVGNFAVGRGDIDAVNLTTGARRRANVVHNVAVSFLADRGHVSHHDAPALWARTRRRRQIVNVVIENSVIAALAVNTDVSVQAAAADIESLDVHIGAAVLPCLAGRSDELGPPSLIGNIANAGFFCAAGTRDDDFCQSVGSRQHVDGHAGQCSARGILDAPPGTLFRSVISPVVAARRDITMHFPLTRHAGFG